MSINRATGSWSYNVLCDVCGFKKKASEVRKRWDGFMVCHKDWETRHPMDFYTTKNDTHQLPFVRPNDTSNGIDVGPSINTTTQTYITVPTVVSQL